MFRQAKRRTAGRRNFEQTKASLLYQSGVSGTATYASRTSFYTVPPLEEITLEEFEQWAIDRLKVLIEIESCVARSKPFREIEATLRPLLLKYLPLSPEASLNAATILQERKKDHYLHFILRLVFCRTEDLRKKFVKNETILFRIRFSLMTPREQIQFKDAYSSKLPWNYITNEEKMDMFDELYASTGSTIRNALLAESSAGAGDSTQISSDQLKLHIRNTENFIKLPFEKVPHLISSRLVLVRAGHAYVPSSLQLNLLAVEFSDDLSACLLRTFQSLPRLEEDDRLLPVLNNLSHNFSSCEYDASSIDPALASDINASSITQDTITQHYPLCALHLQRSLVANSHLKYQGRQQLGLFLKGIGLSVDEALKFWAHQFTKGATTMTMEKFNKEYKYNIRHLYGLEGARINYKPWDCATILSKPRPGKGESHGCPYRDLPVDSLVSNLNEMGIHDQQDINVVVDDVSSREYTVACTRVFELTHKKQLATAKVAEDGMHISHPNLYFDRSRQLERADTKVGA